MVYLNNKKLLNSYSLRRVLPQYGLNEVLNVFGVFCVLLYALTWISPSLFTPHLRITSLLFGFICSLLLFLKYRSNYRSASILLALIALVQIWSIFTNIYASFLTGRPINSDRSALYLIEYIIPFFLAYNLQVTNPRISGLMLSIIFFVFSLSCIVGYLQFLRIPFFFKLADYYTYKAIDNWGGVSGIRAVGLSWHPNEFCLHAMVCFGISLYRIVQGRNRTRYLAMLLFFGGAVLISGSRSGILSFILLLAVLLPYLYRLQPKIFLASLYVSLFLLLSVFLLAPRKFGYLTQSPSVSNDASYKTRTDVRWQQAYDIYRDFPITGIGPDQSLTFGLGGTDKFVPKGETMESMYMLYLACHGIIGLILVVALFALLLFDLLRNIYFRPRDSLCHRVSFVCLSVTMYTVTTAYAMNTVDHVTVLPLLFTTCAFVYASKHISSPTNHVNDIKELQPSRI